MDPVLNDMSPVHINNLILSSHILLHFPSSLIPLAFPTKIFYIILISLVRVDVLPISSHLTDYVDEYKL
jgi:hypothetical protein